MERSASDNQIFGALREILAIAADLQRFLLTASGSGSDPGVLPTQRQRTEVQVLWGQADKKISQVLQEMDDLFHRDTEEYSWCSEARAKCEFRPMPITDSGASRSPVPAQADRRFRRKPITDSGASRSLNG